MAGRIVRYGGKKTTSSFNRIGACPLALKGNKKVLYGGGGGGGRVIGRGNRGVKLTNQGHGIKSLENTIPKEENKTRGNMTASQKGETTAE